MWRERLAPLLAVSALAACPALAHAADGTHQDLPNASEGTVDAYDANGSYIGQTRDNSRGGHDVYDASNALVYASITLPGGDEIPLASAVQPAWTVTTPDYSGGFTFLNESGAYFWQVVPNYSGGYDQYSWDGTIAYSSNSLSLIDMSESRSTADLMHVFDFADNPSDPGAVLGDPMHTDDK